MKTLIIKVKCFFKHDRAMAMSFKTGRYEMYCKRCGKTLK